MGANGHDRPYRNGGQSRSVSCGPCRVRGRASIERQEPAEVGQLLILASGPPAAAAFVRPVFSAIGRKTVWLGEEAGQPDEASRPRLHVHLDRGRGQALNWLVSWASTTPSWPRPSRRPAGRTDRGRQAAQNGQAIHPSSFGVGAQDVDLAIAAAGDDELPLLAALSRQWRAAVDAGHGREDVSAARLALGGH